ncbi:hypothetical protein MTO96_002887 [Rhipicephalus appendiculatus]
MAEEELSEKFARREAIERGEIKDLKVSEGFNPYIEFSRKEIKEYEKHFKKFDLNGDHVLDFEELKRMMEILGAPQTHLALKEMIRQVDEDFDGTINFREFLLIFKKAPKAMELNRGNRFEEEIKQEQLERKIEEEERKKRQAAFMEKANFFKNAAAT